MCEKLLVVMLLLIGIFQALVLGVSSKHQLRTASNGYKNSNNRNHYSIEQYQTMGVFNLLDTTPDATCTTTRNERCSISDFASDTVVQIFPGGKTACMDNDSPFGFVVNKRDPAKVLLYFAGGGACWDEFTYSVGLCKIDNSIPEVAGIFATDTPSTSKFSTYTTILITYCSGDIFLSDKTAEYTDSAGRPIKQKGRQNVLAVLEWIQEQFGDDNFFGNELEELVLGGASAGALGSPIWARHLFNEIPARHTALLADSYVNPVPPVFMGQLLKEVAGICDYKVILPSWEEREKCEAGELTINEMIMLSMHEHPKTTFAYIQPKWDQVQLLYTNAILDNYGQPTISSEEFYNRTLDVISELDTMPNFVIYLVEDSGHTYLNRQAVFKVDPLGTCGGTCNRGYPSINTWISLLPLYDGGSIHSQCAVNAGSTGRCDPGISSKISYFVPDFDTTALNTLQFSRMLYVAQTDREDINLHACQVLTEEGTKKKRARVHFQSGAIYVPEVNGVLTAYFRTMLRFVNMNPKSTLVRFVLGNTTFRYEWEQALGDDTQHFQLLNHDGSTMVGNVDPFYFESALQIDIGRLGRQMTLISAGQYFLEVQIVHYDGVVNQCIRALISYPSTDNALMSPL